MFQELACVALSSIAKLPEEMDKRQSDCDVCGELVQRCGDSCATTVPHSALPMAMIGRARFQQAIPPQKNLLNLPKIRDSTDYCTRIHIYPAEPGSELTKTGLSHARLPLTLVTWHLVIEKRSRDKGRPASEPVGQLKAARYNLVPRYKTWFMQGTTKPDMFNRREQSLCILSVGLLHTRGAKVTEEYECDSLPAGEKKPSPCVTGYQVTNEYSRRLGPS